GRCSPIASQSRRPGGWRRGGPGYRAPACRKLLDEGSLLADSRAHRATHVAPHVIEQGHGRGKAERLLAGGSQGRMVPEGSLRTGGGQSRWARREARV